MLLESLGAYLPMDRLRAIADGSALPERAAGAALFADISGFTPLTNALARELGPQRGAEELTRALNAVYTALIAEVANYGGSVISFSGDAITCWFDSLQRTADSAQRNETGAPGSALSRSTLSAVACALALQHVMEQFAAVPTPSGSTVSLRLKVAVASGTVRRFQVGDPQYMQLDTLVGDLLDRLATAEHAARRGEVIVDIRSIPQLVDYMAISEHRLDERGAPSLPLLAG
ncbi:adenylate/guanylate cyclase domain-containing protein [Candidatus Gracilibacteria bacterium]|nr:adenylate/guanylate cyclase domain-containing protein [Candidatus Gracilibacteria bacterium]